MIAISDEDRIFIEDNIPQAKDSWNSWRLGDVLDVLFDLIEEKGFAPPHFYDYNDFGRKAQKVYDRVFINNIPEEEKSKYLIPLVNPGFCVERQQLRPEGRSDG